MMTRARKGGRRDGEEGGVCNPVGGLVVVVLYDMASVYTRPVR